MSSKYWILTINNPSFIDYLFFARKGSRYGYACLQQEAKDAGGQPQDEDVCEQDAEPGPKDIRFFIAQFERGAHGALHIQAYVEFTGRKRLTRIKKLFPTAHAEIRRGTQQEALNYFRKQETRISGPVSFGTHPESNQE